MNRFGGTLMTLALVAVSTAAQAQQTGAPAGPPPSGARPGGAGMMAAGAQQAGGTIHGTVRDASSGAALGGASIAVRSAADSSLVTGAVARADGSFRIEGVRPGTYYLRVSRLGYNTATVSRVAVTGPQAVADAGTVRLAAGAVGLAGVTATAERAAVVSTPDRTVVSTRDMPAVSGGNATDVLRNVPGVDVDGDGKVSLRGNQNVAIQINGRPAPLTGDALTNFIKQLPANLVDRVEVVPNPSAKYDPDGMGGILNIVLKQNTDLGTSGGLTLGGGTGGRYNASGNLGTQRGPLTLFGSYGFNREARDAEGYSLRSALVGGVPQNYIEQVMTGDFLNQSHTFNGNGELKLGSRNVLSSAFMLNKRLGNQESGSGVRWMDADQVTTGDYDLLTTGRARGLSTDYLLAFKRTLQPQRNEWTAQAHFNRSRDHFLNAFQTMPGTIAPALLAGDSRNDLNSVNRQLDWQADVTRQLSTGTRLEAGYKGILRRLANDYTVDSIFGGVPDLSLRLENDFTYDENVQAGYGLLTQTITPKLSVQGGLRLERAWTTFRLASGESFDNDYTSLFPSAAATLQVGQKDQVRFSYSKRINRPATFQLNPFPFVQDRNNIFVGNPGLKPEYTHAYEASFTHATSMGSLTVTPFYRHTVNAVRRYQAFGSDGVDTATFANLATANSYGTDANLQLRLGRLSGFVGASAFKMVTDGSNVSSGLGADVFTWTARASLNFKLSPSTDVQWFQFYRPATNTEQGRLGSMGMANVAVRQKLSDKASLNLRVADPFDAMRFSFTASSSSYSQEQLRRFNARAVYLSFSYNFGRPPRLRMPQQQPEQPAGGDQPGMPGGPGQ
ncbi:MAG TPA: TonB-dependent receptor [Longimicrobium sp.]